MRSHVAGMQRQPPDLQPLQVHPIGVPAIGIARACLAALQGGQAGEHPPTRIQVGQPRIKTAASSANRRGFWPAFTSGFPYLNNPIPGSR